MTIIRTPRPVERFTIVRNEVFDEGLSAEALGMLCYLLSRPDNWRISKKELGNRFGMGRDKTNRLVKELCDARYMEVRQPRDENGRVEDAIYTCFDVKQTETTANVKSAPVSGNPSTGSPSPENQYLLNTDNKQRTDKTKGAGGLLPGLDTEQDAFDMFASVAKAEGLTVPQMLNQTRRAHIRQRLMDCGGLDGWRVAMGKLAASPLLTGKVKDWRADLDFVLQPTRFAKLMEGGYDGRTETTGNGHCRNAARQDAINEAARELAAEFG